MNELSIFSENISKHLDIMMFTKLIKHAETLKEAKRINECLRDYITIRAIPEFEKDTSLCKRLFK